MKINFTNVRAIIGKRFLKIMMRTLIFTCCFTVFSLTPSTTLSQNAKITVETDKVVTVDEVFNMISDQTDYNFIYPVDLFEKAPKIHLKKGKVKISSLLEDCIISNNLNLIIFLFWKYLILRWCKWMTNKYSLR